MAEATTPILQIKALSKQFEFNGDRIDALRDANLTVKKGEFICLIGASGCGKSTLLRIVAGFEPATRGWITQERTEPGHIGDPGAATAEKGETLFRVFSDDVVAFLERVIAWDGKGWNG